MTADVRSVNVERCRSCTAALRPGADWCGLCYAPVGVEPEPERTPSMLVGSASAGSSMPAPPPARAVQGWPCTACGALNDFSVSSCAGCGAAFLATTRPGFTLPLVGDLSRLSAPQRMMLAIGASPVLAVFLVLVLTLVGSVV